MKTCCCIVVLLVPLVVFDSRFSSVASVTFSKQRWFFTPNFFQHRYWTVSIIRQSIIIYPPVYQSLRWLTDDTDWHTVTLTHTHTHWQTQTHWARTQRHSTPPTQQSYGRLRQTGFLKKKKGQDNILIPWWIQSNCSRQVGFLNLGRPWWFQSSCSKGGVCEKNTGIYYKHTCSLRRPWWFESSCSRQGRLVFENNYRDINIIHAAFAVRDDLNQVVQDKVVWFLKKW